MRAQALHRSTGTWSIWQVVPPLVLSLQLTSASAYEWEIEVVDSTVPAFHVCGSSLALDSTACPHIAYHNGGEHDLRYAYRSGFGHAGWHIELVDTAGTVGEYASLALDSSGHAHISYFDRSNADLKYACKLADGWHVETVDSLGDNGEHTSLALSGAGYPHISYFDATNEDLKYAYRDASGWHTETVDAEGDVGWYTSLALDASGHAHLSYFDATKGDLKYAYRDASGWYTETADSAGYAGGYTGAYSSLALDGSGNPHISHVREWGAVLYACMDESGEWNSEIVYGSNIGGEGPTSLAIDDSGSPHLCFQWEIGCIGTMVSYAYKDSIWHMEALTTGRDVSLALGSNGLPHVSFNATPLGPFRGLTYARALQPVVVMEDPVRPLRIELLKIWPNPSRGVVYARVICSDVEAPVSLKVLDLLGRRLATLPLQGATRSGDAAATLRLPDSVPSGQYFVGLDGDGQGRFTPVTIMR